MARVDIKRSNIRIRDGDTRTGAINNVAGYSTTTTTMLVDGLSAAIAAGRIFTLGGKRYTVVSTVGGATPTSIVIAAPGLLTSVADNAVIVVLGNELDIKVGEGTLTYGVKRNIEYMLNRGNLDAVREGDQVPLDVAIDATWEYITGSGAVPTIEDMLYQTGPAAAYLSTDSDACQPYCVDIEVVYDPNCPVGDTETILFPQFRYENIEHDLKAGTIKVSGKCNVIRPTAVRVAGP